MERTSKATNFAIIMKATKELMGELLIDSKGEPARKFDLVELVYVLDKCKYISSPSMKNNIFRYIYRFGFMDGITMLKGYSHWAYIQRNKFPGQSSNSDKVFVFKISKVGPKFGMHLMKQMQPGGDLEDTWIMFDHVKSVKHWVTMTCHVYVYVYYRVMTISRL